MLIVLLPSTVDPENADDLVTPYIAIERSILSEALPFSVFITIKLGTLHLCLLLVARA